MLGETPGQTRLHVGGVSSVCWGARAAGRGFTEKVTFELALDDQREETGP